MRKFFLVALLAAVSSVPTWAQKAKTYDVKSPDGQTSVRVTVGEDIRYDVISHGEEVMKGNDIALVLRDRTLGMKPVVKSVKKQEVRETVRPVFKLKCAEVDNSYNLLTLSFKDGFKVLWRVYDDGVAYRIETSLPAEVEVMKEKAGFNVVSASTVVVQQCDSVKTACEELYARVPVSGLSAESMLCELPILAEGSAQKVLISEFDLKDYPGMFLKPVGGSSFAAYHTISPLKTEDDDDRDVFFLEISDWIAKTSGTRSYPWRYMLITSDDRKLAENRMPMRLAPETEIEDLSWISRGQTTWDWLNGIPYGQGVDFKSGINLETYKYFTDFAAKNGVKYILLDEGWALDTRDPFKTNPEVHIHELISYAASKGVGVILWLPWLTVEHHMDLFEVFEGWGIKGVKIDFMNRQDQWMVDFYERVAKTAAEHHIFVDFHGAYSPRGLEYRYPNVLTFEGVRGLEFCSNCRPDNTLFQPYIRNAVGPMDFTPGMMICKQPEKYSGGRPETPAVGTKASQLAQIVAFETGLQMLADNPCRYDMWPDCRDFMTAVPVEWDETVVLSGKVGEHYIVAKRAGDVWYIAGLNNSQARSIDVDLSFLGEGSEWIMESFSDGPVADRIAMDYRRNFEDVTASSSLAVGMARNGGFAAVLKRKIVDIQAHRGGMGLYPEESLAAMLNSVDLGVHTLEMDLCITKDGKVVLSHDPYFHHRYATRPDRTEVKSEDPKVYLYQLPYSEIVKWDVGHKYNPGWPEKKCIPAVKPLAAEVIAAVEEYTKAHGLAPIKYNIEIKSSPEKGEGELWPEYHEFTDLCMAVLESFDLGDRLIIQSFDERALNYINKKYPGHILSFLWEGYETDFDLNMSQVDFIPQWVSPEHGNVNAEFMEKAHAKGMKVVTWTVDDPDEIRRLLDLKVEAIISNYPDRLLKVVEEYK